MNANLFQALLDNSPDYIFFKDRESRFIKTNKAHAQGCSVLKDTDIIEDIIKVHRVLEEFKADIFDLVLAQDVEGKTSQFGEDMGMRPYPRFVFAHGHITNMVISIFNAPVMADSLTKLLGTQDKG